MGDVVREALTVELHSQAAGTKAWRNTINKGVDAFIEEVKKRLGQT